MIKSGFRWHVIGILVAGVVLAGTLRVDVAWSQDEETFDHFATGFRLEGMHRAAECETCHNDGLFTGTPTQCVGCHTPASQVRATWQPPRHIVTTENCDGCHRPISWVPVARVDHLEVRGTCSSCHDNFRARGQHAEHIQTTSECDACHNTRFWRL